MKYIYIIFLVTLFIGCDNIGGVKFDRLTPQGSGDSITIYYGDKLFTGLGYSKSNGKYINKVNYLNGLKHGLSETWYRESSQKYIEVNYINGKQHGLWTSWHPNGQLRGITNLKNGIREGESKEWFENNGQLKRMEIYKDDVCLISTNYKDDGNLYIVTEYLGDDLYTSKQYYDNGNLKSFLSYKKSKTILHGRCAHYLESGELKWESYYKDGEKLK